MTAVTDGLGVLVIDDHAFQRSVLARQLKSLGVVRVLEAHDGASALAVVRANRDSLMLIITDVDMPEMDGLEFLRRLAEEAPRTPVAIHSALDGALADAAANLEDAARAGGWETTETAAGRVDGDTVRLFTSTGWSKRSRRA